MAVNKKYSFADFTGQSFLDVDPAEFSDSEIVGSCFAQEAPYLPDASHASASGHADPRVLIFPPGVENLTLTRCNLDNVNIRGYSVKGGTNRKIRIMNDLEDWVLDADNRPAEPMNKKQRIRAGANVNPLGIPNIKREKRLRLGGE